MYQQPDFLTYVCIKDPAFDVKGIYCLFEGQSVDFVQAGVMFYFNTDSMIRITFVVFFKMICTFFLALSKDRTCYIQCGILSHIFKEDLEFLVRQKSCYVSQLLLILFL